MHRGGARDAGSSDSPLRTTLCPSYFGRGHLAIWSRIVALVFVHSGRSAGKGRLVIGKHAFSGTPRVKRTKKTRASHPNTPSRTGGERSEHPGHVGAGGGK
jgi:hypothetical protein